MIENFVLGSFIAYNCALLVLKMKYIKIEEESKDNILKNGLYHFTSEENAEKILKDGHISPSGILSSLGAKKTFFFAGIPSIDILKENVAAYADQFEWTAIHIKPDEKDLSNYRIRAYDDNSVICKGQCNLEKEKVRKVNLVLDMNQEGIPYIREKNQKEIEEGYEPSEKLKKKLRINNSLVIVTKNLMQAYIKKPMQLFSKFIWKIKIKFSLLKFISAIKKKKEKINLNEDIKEEHKENDDRKKNFQKYIVNIDNAPKINTVNKEISTNNSIDIDQEIK